MQCILYFIFVFFLFSSAFDGSFSREGISRHLSTLTLILDQVCTEVKCIILSLPRHHLIFSCLTAFSLPAAMCVQCVVSAHVGVNAHISNISLSLYIEYVSRVYIAVNSRAKRICDTHSNSFSQTDETVKEII